MKSQLFGVEEVRTRAKIYGLPDRLRAGVLPHIEEAVNAQEVFESSSRTARRFMRLEGENWDLEFDTREVTVSATNFLDSHAIEEGVSFFLGQIKECVHCHFWAHEVLAHARWPLEPNPRRKKSAGQILYEKSSRLKAEHLSLLPPGGVLGAGITLLGIDDENDLTWTLDAGPVRNALFISLRVNFDEPEPSEWPDDELGQVQANIRRTYTMMDNEVKAFIDAVMP